MKKTLLILLMLTSSSAVFASFSSDIPLSPSYGFMNPKQTIKFDLKGLVAGVNYDIVCDNIAVNMPQNVDVYYKGAQSVKLLDKFSSSNVFTIQYDYSPIGYKDVVFRGANLDKSATFELTNLDDAATVSFTNCVAKVQH